MCECNHLTHFALLLSTTEIPVSGTLECQGQWDPTLPLSPSLSATFGLIKEISLSLALLFADILSFLNDMQEQERNTTSAICVFWKFDE